MKLADFNKKEEFPATWTELDIVKKDEVIKLETKNCFILDLI
ncbi:hypothetical protein [Gottschalkia acidurici]|nr:hypothetical protein [Gottschalkia acidurici]